MPIKYNGDYLVLIWLSVVED